MQIVATGSSFTLYFAPKHKAEVLGTLTLTNTGTNTDTTPTVEYFENDYYVEADVTATVAEGEEYEYKVYDDQSNLSYIGRFLVSDQSDYSPHDSKYVHNSSDNEYLTR